MTARAFASAVLATAATSRAAPATTVATLRAALVVRPSFGKRKRARSERCIACGRAVHALRERTPFGGKCFLFFSFAYRLRIKTE
nr:MAG: MC036R [Molluscum contagiosum virus]